MRLWTLHPKYLDPAGLVALWREGLLAQRVLAGGTRGYRSHPQLLRFRAAPDPLAAIAAYLRSVHEEATARGYSFDSARILPAPRHPPIAATRGQLEFEKRHLVAKLTARCPDRLRALRVARLEAHPLFRVVPGPVEEWERAATGSRRDRT
jgi:hypothetical protein